LPEAKKMGLCILGMKSMGSGVILKSSTFSAPDCLRCALSQPTSVVNTDIDNRQVLDQAIETGSNFKELNSAELQASLHKSEPAAVKGEFELFKTTSHFDSTAQHPEWLGPETQKVQQLGSEA